MWTPAEAAQALSDIAWLTLLHGVWLGLLVGSLSALATSAGGLRSHRARRAVFLAGLLVVAVASPLVAVLHRMTQLGTGHEVAIRTAVGPEVDASPAEAATAHPDGPTATSPDGLTPSFVAKAREAIDAAAQVAEAVRPYVLAAWGAGVLTFAGLLAVGSFRLRRLRRESTANAALQARLRARARLLRLRRVPSVRLHPGVAEPFLAGLLRPVIILPSAWAKAASADAVDAVLAHELAHARRLDHLANLLQRLVEAAYFFHPCVRWLSRSARREAEHAADALAARITGDPAALARALDSVARSRGPRPRIASLGLAVGGDRAVLLPRIQELLGMTPTRPRFTRWPLAALPAALVTSLIAASAYEPSTTTDDSSEPTPSSYLDGSSLALQAPIADRPKAELQLTDVPEEVRARLFAGRPMHLSRKDLITRVRLMPHDKGDPTKLSREDLLAIVAPEQVSLWVRYLAVRHDPAVKVDGIDSTGRAAWLVGTDWLDRFEDTLMRSSGKIPLRSPKMTTFERAAAIIVNQAITDSLEAETRALRTAGDDGDADGRILARLDGPAPEPGDGGFVVDRLDARLTLQISAVRKPGGHAIEVRYIGSLPAEGKEPTAPRRTVERRVLLNVPDGSSVLLDSGLDVIGAGDAPPPAPHLRPLLAITPFHIPNDAEEEAMSGPVEEFAGGVR